MAAHWSHEEMRNMIRGCSVSDDETRGAISAVYHEYGYYLDPHGAVGWAAAEKLAPKDIAGKKTGPVVLATAHPAKFSETVESLTGPVPVPQSIRRAMVRKAEAKTIPNDLGALRNFLLT
jgi:threonine synthase